MKTTIPSQAQDPDFCKLVVGSDIQVPLLDGTQVRYVNLDNAASTPPFVSVHKVVNEFAPWYSSVHRGSGYKSLISTQLFDEAREVLLDFVGADPKQDVVIFGKNASEAINKLAHRLPFNPGDVVISTMMEHHSNDLPWRAVAQVVYVGLNEDGSLDLEDLQVRLDENRGKVRLVAITGASNVTGYVNPVHEIARMAHAAGAWIFVDGAQLFPHRKIDMGAWGEPEHIDFLALAGHKAYAPYGAGALIGPYEVLNQGEPEYRGGGTIELVTLDEVRWADTPERDEAGSPNLIGIIAMAAAVRQMKELGMETLASHEADLTSYALERLNAIPGLIIYGSSDPKRVQDRLGVITFNLEGKHHALVAAALSFEGGVGVRNGCFCAHPYVIRLLKVSEEEFQRFRGEVIVKNRSNIPGMVRASFGCYSQRADVDRLVEQVERISDKGIQADYRIDPVSGSYFPVGYSVDKLRHFFSF